MQRGGLAPGSVKVPEPAKGPGLPRTPTAGLRRRPATPGLPCLPYDARKLKLAIKKEAT